MEIPKFKTKAELFAYLKEHEDDLIYSKKNQFKKADAFSAPLLILEKGMHSEVNKAKVDKQDPVSEVKVRAIINTTMVMDSHKDVHLNKCWNKTVDENKRMKHLQEHQMNFDKIIADKEDLTPSVKKYTWKQLGYDMPGSCEALVFDSTVKESRNPVMFKEYLNKNVDNHSVGMYYVTIKMAINSDEEGYEKYKAEYDKHINQIANKEEVEKNGYYYAVYEAKAIEGSAVPLGSNSFTPTLDVGKEFKDENINKDDEAYLDAIKNWLKQ